MDSRTKTVILRTRRLLASALGEKMKKAGLASEWEALKSLDELLLQELENPVADSPVERLALKQPGTFYAGSFAMGTPVRPKTYVELAAELIEKEKQPVRSASLVEYITKKRDIRNLSKAKINIISAMSHDQRFKSYDWKNGKAWWWAEKPLPQTEAADLLS